jgi:anti-sigma-K factor RskA
MSSPKNDVIQEQLAAYALGALDVEDMIAVERHLADSPAARAELDQLRQVVGMLPYAAPPVEPPERVRQQLFSRIQDSTVAQSRTAPSQPVKPAAERRSIRYMLVPAATTILAVMVLVLGGLTMSLQQTIDTLATRNNELQASVATFEESVVAMQNRQADLETQLADNERTLGVLNQQIRSVNRIFNRTDAGSVHQASSQSRPPHARCESQDVHVSRPHISDPPARPGAAGSIAGRFSVRCRPLAGGSTRVNAFKNQTQFEQPGCPRSL